MEYERNYSPIAVSIAEAAKTLNLSRTKVYELLQAGELDSRKVGRRRIITMASIHRLLQSASADGGRNA